jgi:hypothetical protein
MEGSCIIVGGGPSLRDFNFTRLKGHNTIVVNQAIFQVPDADYFITTDYTWVVKSNILSNAGLAQYYQNHLAEKIFILALSEDRLKIIDEKHCVDTQYGLLYDLTVFDRVVRPVQYGGLGRTFEEFHYGSDSGFAALQLAAILGYDKIYLLGFDFCTSGPYTHCHDDYSSYPTHSNYEGRLTEFMIPYPEAFRILRERGIQIFSCSHISKLNQHLLYVDVGTIL